MQDLGLTAEQRAISSRGEQRAMHLADLISDGDVLAALEPEELGLHILQVLAKWHPNIQIQMGPFINGALTGYSSYQRRNEIEQAIREAWLGLRDKGFFFPNLGFDTRLSDRRRSGGAQG